MENTIENPQAVNDVHEEEVIVQPEPSTFEDQKAAPVEEKKSGKCTLFLLLILGLVVGLVGGGVGTYMYLESESESESESSGEESEVNTEDSEAEDNTETEEGSEDGDQVEGDNNYMSYDFEANDTSFTFMYHKDFDVSLSGEVDGVYSPIGVLVIGKKGTDNEDKDLSFNIIDRELTEDPQVPGLSEEEGYMSSQTAVQCFAFNSESNFVEVDIGNRKVLKVEEEFECPIGTGEVTEEASIIAYGVELSDKYYAVFRGWDGTEEDTEIIERMIETLKIV